MDPLVNAIYDFDAVEWNEGDVYSYLHGFYSDEYIINDTHSFKYSEHKSSSNVTGTNTNTYTNTNTHTNGCTSTKVGMLSVVVTVLVTVLVSVI